MFIELQTQNWNVNISSAIKDASQNNKKFLFFLP